METDQDQVYFSTYLSPEDCVPPPALVFDVNGTPIWWQPFGGSISDITLESEIIFNRKELAITRLDGHL